MEPLAGYGVGDSSQHCEFLCVQRLIQISLQASRLNIDSTELFVSRHWISSRLRTPFFTRRQCALARFTRHAAAKYSSKRCFALMRLICAFVVTIPIRSHNSRTKVVP